MNGAQCHADEVLADEVGSGEADSSGNKSASEQDAVLAHFTGAGERVRQLSNTGFHIIDGHDTVVDGRAAGVAQVEGVAGSAGEVGPDTHIDVAIR